MFQFYTCLTVDHDWRLVVLAAAVCLLSSAVAIGLFHRAQATTGRECLAWMSVGAAAGGCGIWATHFIAMLAYIPAVGGHYGVLLTILSLLIAMLFSIAGFGLALVRGGRMYCAAGGAVVGGGIAAMHYTGMFALEFSQFIVWSPEFVVASVAFGIIFGAFALSLAVRGDDWGNTSVAIALLTVAIVTMHFTGMAAIETIPDLASLHATAFLSPTLFSVVVAAVTMIVLGMCLVAALSDRRWKGTLLHQKFLLNTAIENMSQGLGMFDARGRVVLYNSHYIRMTGLPAAPIKGRFLLDLFRQRRASGHLVEDPDQHISTIMTAMRSGRTNTRHVQVADRTLRIIEVPMRNGGWTATLEDVTESLLTQSQISHMAHHDALTDLANRTQLIEKLRIALAALPAQGPSVALYFIDLDRFKGVNDTMGHDKGDLLLKAVADRLRGLVGPDDTVARLGGDEFVVLRTGVTCVQDAEEFVRRVAAATSEPIELEGQTLSVSASIGVALAPADASNPDRLLKSADIAMYKAKADGRNCVRFFTPEMDAELQSRTVLERRIRDAIETGGFQLNYQPLVEVSDRRISGFEALIRLPRENGTLISPLEFIPLAEELRLIDKIGAWVLREACRTAADWPDHLTVAVNLSPAQFIKGNLYEIVSEALQSAGLPPRRLELEITENLLLTDSAGNLSQLKRLKELGVSIVIDDFGTGYSSLSYLWKFPFDKIKIDRSFMKGSDGSGRDAAAVVKAIIALARELKMRVTVEGVETPGQVAFLDEIKGVQAQGYYFGRPVPAIELAAQLFANHQMLLAERTRGKGDKGGLRLVKALAKH
jgi:diguanylate cyclase (GGDEF)-like protein